jgi:hypothetical protein
LQDGSFFSQALPHLTDNRFFLCPTWQLLENKGAEGPAKAQVFDSKRKIDA